MSQQLREVLPRHHRRAFGRGAMTAALVIVPVHSARARARLGTASATKGSVAQAGKSPRVAGGIHAVPDELPWMVRLSTGGGAETGAAQQPLTVEPWVDPAGNTQPRPRLLAAVPTYRLASHIF